MSQGRRTRATRLRPRAWPQDPRSPCALPARHPLAAMALGAGNPGGGSRTCGPDWLPGSQQGPGGGGHPDAGDSTAREAGRPGRSPRGGPKVTLSGGLGHWLFNQLQGNLMCTLSSVPSRMSQTPRTPPHSRASGSSVTGRPRPAPAPSCSEAHLPPQHLNDPGVCLVPGGTPLPRARAGRGGCSVCDSGPSALLLFLGREIRSPAPWRAEAPPVLSWL